MSSKRDATAKNLVYIYEDTISTTGNLLRHIKKFGFEAMSFSDPKLFLSSVRTQKPPLCFLRMSPDNTSVLAAIIKSIRNVLGDRPLLIAVYKTAEQPLLQKLIDAGADGRLKSPVKSDDIARKLAEYLETSALSEAVQNLTSTTLVIDIELPKIVDWFFKKISPVLASVAGSLENLDEIEMQLKFHAEKVRPYQEEFREMVNSKRNSEEKADLVQCLRLYGINNVRCLVAAERLSAATGSGVFAWNTKTKMLAAEPRKILQYTSRASQLFGEESSYRQIAFNCGLVLDLLYLLAEEAGDRKVAVRKQIESGYNEAIRKASTGLKAGQALKDLALAKHIITTFLMKEAGKAAMAIFYPDYLEMLIKWDKKQIRPILQQIAEREKFGISHNIIGTVMSQNLPGLGAASQGILFSDAPYLLQKSKADHDAYTLSAICHTL